MSQRTMVSRILTIALTFVVVAAAVIAVGHFGLFEAVFRPGALMPVDFATLQRPATPNTFLIAPQGFTPVMSDGEAPVYGVSVEKLKENWNAMIAAQPDVEKKGESADGLQIDYVQRTRLMRYPDWITVRFIPLPSNPETGNYSTVAVYSRSVYGHGDLGANQARVMAWLKLL